MICENCKETIDDDAKFCPSCGTKVTVKKSKPAKAEEPKDRAEKIYQQTLQLIQDWATDDEKNKENIRINKLIAETHSEPFLAKMATITRDAFLFTIPDVGEKKFDLINKVGGTVYWSVFHGFLAFTAEKNVDELPLTLRADTYEKISKNYDEYTVNLNNDMQRVLEALASNIMSRVEELDDTLGKLGHKEYDQLKLYSNQAIVTGYSIAASVWK